jgi:hypothetical protein
MIQRCYLPEVLPGVHRPWRKFPANRGAGVAYCTTIIYFSANLARARVPHQATGGAPASFGPMTGPVWRRHDLQRRPTFEEHTIYRRPSGATALTLLAASGAACLWWCTLVDRSKRLPVNRPQSILAACRCKKWLYEALRAHPQHRGTLVPHSVPSAHTLDAFRCMAQGMHIHPASVLQRCFKAMTIQASAVTPEAPAPVHKASRCCNTTAAVYMSPNCIPAHSPLALST